MCVCENKERAEAWDKVYDILHKHNPKFSGRAGSGLQSALLEVKRLQAIEGCLEDLKNRTDAIPTRDIP